MLKQPRRISSQSRKCLQAKGWACFDRSRLLHGVHMGSHHQYSMTMIP